jgi:hypothetical protein
MIAASDSKRHDEEALSILETIREEFLAGNETPRDGEVLVAAFDGGDLLVTRHPAEEAFAIFARLDPTGLVPRGLQARYEALSRRQDQIVAIIWSSRVVTLRTLPRGGCA